jgi:tetratricopeptide (TPR) repeat protein
MIRRWLCLLAVVVAPVAGEPASVLSDDWVKVQRSLATSDREEFADRMRQLRERAVELQARRLTPYAEGLVTWASGHPDALGGLAVRSARELDPELPSSYFLVARWQWKRGDAIGAIRSYIAGWWAMFLFEPSRTMLGAAAVPWLLLALGWAVLLAVLVQTLQFLPRVGHDAVELSRLVFRPVNALALAAAVLVLPLFGGLGPIWLLVYLFVLGWAYMKPGQRLSAALSCALLASIVPGLASWEQVMMRWPSLESRIASMLDERRIDFPSLRELATLEEDFESSASYHIVLGELHRMHGDVDEARIEFQRAAVADADDPRSRVFLGNMALEDGDVQLAIQLYNDAIEDDSTDALAHRNLAVAYDQSRRFQDGDAARTAAKEIAGAGWQLLGIPGRDPRVRYPALGRRDVEGLAAEAPADVRLSARRGFLLSSVVEGLFSPASAVFWLLGLVGIVVQAVRHQWMWTAQRCSKCGKTYCPKCKTSTESDSLCSQCISVFLKRDVVAAELQAAKQARVRRWGIWSSAMRRVAGVLIPGSHDLIDGRPWLGIATGALAWTFLFGALVWAPMVMPSIEPLAAVRPIQVLLGLGFLALWLRGVIGAWQES